MKFAVLQSIGHNIAASLGSGVGLPIGVHFTDIYGEAARGPEGHILVDFLTGSSSGSAVSSKLSLAISRYHEALIGLCARHSVPVSAFRTLTANYLISVNRGHFIVTIEDEHGRRAEDEYTGFHGARLRAVDKLGRIRRVGTIWHPRTVA